MGVPATASPVARQRRNAVSIEVERKALTAGRWRHWRMQGDWKMTGSLRLGKAFPLVLATAAPACTVASLDEPSASQASSLTTFEVGPGRAYASLKNVATLLKPGDVVNVYGDA